MSYHNPTPVPHASKHVNAAWTVTSEDVAGIMNWCEPHRAYDQKAFDDLTDEDVKRVTDATLDCKNFDHQRAMADYTLSLILLDKGYITRAENAPDEADYPDED
jgi:hypothetical protein